MHVNADIKDVVRNYELSNEDGFLFCLFEAVSNALYCSMENQNIRIRVNLTRQYRANEINKDTDNYIQSFKIEDNGIGFTSENFDKFTKTIYKTNHEGGKGSGRIAFLKVFSDVKIESVFREDGNVYRRAFSFDAETVRDNKKPLDPPEENKTTVTFKKIKPEFQETTKRNVDYYQKELLRHFYIFLYYLMENKKSFEIRLIDDSGKESERVIDTAMLGKDKVEKEEFTIEDKLGLNGLNNTVNFELLHIKTKNIEENKAFYVVDERSAGEIANLDLPPNLLGDESGFDYYYYAYLKSPFFGRFLNESRTKLSLPREKKNQDEKIITEEKIQKIMKEKITKFLSYELSVLNQKNEARVIEALKDKDNNKVENARGYLYILSDDETKQKLLNTIKYSDDKKKILSKIRNFHEELQEKTITQINRTVELLKNDKKNEIDFEDFERKFTLLSEQANIENSVNLSSYIMYRKYILDLLDEGIHVYEKSRKQNEGFFHNLLMPKGSIDTKNSNLWLIDDMFLYFEGTSEASIEDIEIGGNKVIRELTKDEKEMLNEFNKKRLKKRIDLLFFPEEKKCIIIELKDPKVGIDDNISQMDKYAKLLANFVKPEFSIENFFTYLITDNFNKYDKPGNGYRKIYGIDGFVRNSVNITSYENDNTIADQYSEVIRYTDIHKRASNRNRIYIEKLNIRK
ncbi:MAG: ATP-binding protein [Treponema sp.]|jgi:hypothetical protein|nr:ATP-binding protein [Treponema sp.]